MLCLYRGTWQFLLCGWYAPPFYPHLNLRRWRSWNGNGFADTVTRVGDIFLTVCQLFELSVSEMTWRGSEESDWYTGRSVCVGVRKRRCLDVKDFVFTWLQCVLVCIKVCVCIFVHVLLCALFPGWRRICFAAQSIFFEGFRCPPMASCCVWCVCLCVWVIGLFAWIGQRLSSGRILTEAVAEIHKL